MFTEDDLLPISALQHFVFCERQCALIHLECQWAENRLTVEGDHLHEKVHEDRGAESRGELRIVRGLALRSFQLGLSGIADVVEFWPAAPSDGGACTVRLPGMDWPVASHSRGVQEGPAEVGPVRRGAGRSPGHVPGGDVGGRRA